jgi:hypothetical protein
MKYRIFQLSDVSNSIVVLSVQHFYCQYDGYCAGMLCFVTRHRRSDVERRTEVGLKHHVYNSASTSNNI